MLGCTDAELVEAARNGDVSSFGELYRRHYAAAVGIAYCALSDHHLAEDAAQEAFAVACRDLGRLRRAEIRRLAGCDLPKAGPPAAKSKSRRPLPADVASATTVAVTAIAASWCGNRSGDCPCGQGSGRVALF